MMAVIKLILSYILCFSQIFVPINAWVDSKGEAAYFTEWTVKSEFTENDYITIEKDSDKDFIILNLADIQLSDGKLYTDEGDYTFELINHLVQDNDPDLITLSGDNAWDTAAYLETIAFIDSFGIPWAPVMGNHDGQGCPSEFWAAYQFTQAENCLFRFGPADMGYGNYIINITEEGKIIHTLFMMDTHGDDDFELEDGSIVNGYDHLWHDQKRWYKWAVNGISEIAGGVVESTVIMHIPVVEYVDAWEMVSMPEDGLEFGVLNPDYTDIASGSKNEFGGNSPVNNGFFDLCKELGSTKTMLVGHDHVNDYMIEYQGINLCYSLKTGFGSYWREDMIGGTTININSNGNTDVNHHYYDLVEYGFNVSAD